MSEFVFDDGSIESKVLQFEIKDAKIIKVDKFDLNKWLSAIDKDDQIKKVYLHFCYDQITPGIRAEVNTALANNPNLRIVLKYENMDKRSIENLARQYKMTTNTMKYNTKTNTVTKQDVEVDKILQDNKDKIKFIDYSKYSVGGNDTEVPSKSKRKKYAV